MLRKLLLASALLTLLIIGGAILLATLAGELIKPRLEQELARELNASVSIETVAVDWLNSTADIKVLSLNSIYDQQGNDLKLKRAHADIDALASYQSRSVVLKALRIEGLIYHIETPVSVSGNRIALPSAKSLLEKQITAFDEQIRKGLKAIEDAKTQWQGQLGLLIDEAKIQTYKDQIDRWRYAQDKERMQQLARIEASLRGELQAVSQIERRLRRSRNEQRSAKRRLQRMPQIQAKRFLDPNRVSQQFGEFGSEVIGKELRLPLLQLIHLYALLESIPRQLPADISIAEFSLDGDFAFNGQGSSLQLNGEQLKLHKAEQHLLLEASGEGHHGGEFSAMIGYADKRLSASLDLQRFAIEGLDVGVIEIGDITTPLRAEKAVVDAALVMDLSKTQIEGELAGIIDPVRFAALPEDLPDTGKILAQVLRDTRSFDLQLAVSGHNRAPHIKVSSSLDGIFSEDFLTSVEAQVAASQKDLEQLIQQRYGADINSAENLASELDRLPKLISERKSTLRELIQQVKGLQKDK